MLGRGVGIENKPAADFQRAEALRYGICCDDRLTDGGVKNEGPPKKEGGHNGE